MTRKNKIYGILGTISIVFAVVLYSFLSSSILCENVEIKFVEKSVNNFITKQDVKDMVLREYPDIVGSPIKDVKIKYLQQKINENPSIKKSKIYKEINGVLVVEVQQRIPIVRIINKKNNSFYIDYEGALMPISHTKQKRTIIANGYINEAFDGKAVNVMQDTSYRTLRNIYLIAKHISKDKFMNAQVEQLYRKQNGEYEIIPRVGPHKVLLGIAKKYKKKLNKLKDFYINTLNKEGWNKYSYINLKYKDQIVCTRK